MAAPPNPLVDWGECLARARPTELVGATLLAGPEARVEGVGGLTLVHPRGLARLDVNGGGLEAWEPLEAPAAMCPGRPLWRPVPEGGLPAFNPLPRPLNLGLPGGAGGPLVARARPLDRVVAEEPATPARAPGEHRLAAAALLEWRWGECSRGGGWLVCEGAAAAGGVALVAGEARLRVPCYRFRLSLLHPAGFVEVDSGEAGGLAVTASCPKARVYAASPYGVRVSQRPGLLTVESRLALIGAGGALDALYALASLAPPRLESRPAAHVRCHRAACAVLRAEPVRLAAWAPTLDDGEAELLARYRASRAVVWDAAGRIESPVDGGAFRLPVPGLSWAIVEVEKGPSFLEALRRGRGG